MHLDNQNWDLFQQETDPDKLWENMVENIRISIDEMCPLKKIQDKKI